MRGSAGEREGGKEQGRQVQRGSGAVHLCHALELALGRLSKQQGTSRKEQAARSKEQGAGSKEQAARSKEQAASSKVALGHLGTPRVSRRRLFRRLLRRGFLGLEYLPPGHGLGFGVQGLGFRV